MEKRSPVLGEPFVSPRGKVVSVVYHDDPMMATSERDEPDEAQ